VERVLRKKDAGLMVFEAPQVLERVEKMGDLFEPILKLKQKLPTLTTDVSAGVLARAASEARGAATVSDGLQIRAQAGSHRKSRSKPAKPEKQKAVRKTRKT
jgi:hypothetical protein